MRNKKSILLVEDNPDDEELTRMALEQNHITNKIVVARDGVEAIDYLFYTGSFVSRESSLPSLILLDLKLPRMDGVEVLRRIREDSTTCFLPVVILTSSKEERDIAACYKLGCNSYVQKPVDFTQFVEATRQLGTYWLHLNEPPLIE